jgi:hypothetical protein
MTIKTEVVEIRVIDYQENETRRPNEHAGRGSSARYSRASSLRGTYFLLHGYPIASTCSPASFIREVDQAIVRILIQS